MCMILSHCCAHVHNCIYIYICLCVITVHVYLCLFQPYKKLYILYEVISLQIDYSKHHFHSIKCIYHINFSLYINVILKWIYSYLDMPWCCIVTISINYFGALICKYPLSCKYVSSLLVLRALFFLYFIFSFLWLILTKSVGAVILCEYILDHGDSPICDPGIKRG